MIKLLTLPLSCLYLIFVSGFASKYCITMFYDILSEKKREKESVEEPKLTTSRKKKQSSMTIICRQRVRQSQNPKGKSRRRAHLSLTRNMYADKESDRVRVELQTEGRK